MEFAWVSVVSILHLAAVVEAEAEAEAEAVLDADWVMVPAVSDFAQGLQLKGLAALSLALVRNCSAWKIGSRCDHHANSTPDCSLDGLRARMLERSRCH